VPKEANNAIQKKFAETPEGEGVVWQESYGASGDQDELWVVDFTYVDEPQPSRDVAFCIDAYSRPTTGWRCSASMNTDLPLDALEMGIWQRQRTGRSIQGLVHHSDAGSQGGFKWSSQHLDQEVLE
jgi:putative transposase